MPTYVFDNLLDILNSPVRLGSESGPKVFTITTPRSFFSRTRKVTTLFDIGQHPVALIWWKNHAFDLQGMTKERFRIETMPQPFVPGAKCIIPMIAYILANLITFCLL